MTVIEIRPFRNGWKCFEAPGVDAEAVSSRYLLKSEVAELANARDSKTGATPGRDRPIDLLLTLSATAALALAAPHINRF